MNLILVMLVCISAAMSIGCVAALIWTYIEKRRQDRWHSSFENHYHCAINPYLNMDRHK